MNFPLFESSLLTCVMSIWHIAKIARREFACHFMWEPSPSSIWFSLSVALYFLGSFIFVKTHESYEEF